MSPLTIERRPVWYVGALDADSYDTEAEGIEKYKRAPDAIGLYIRDDAGHLEWISDEPK